MNPPRLLAHLEATCEKHEIRGTDKDALFAWASDKSDDFKGMILQQIADGLIEVVKWDTEDSQPSFALSPAGEKQARSILKEHGCETADEFLKGGRS